MREIKYRAWDTSEKKMHTEISLLFANDLNGVFEGLSECGCIVMQYTGLNDKNGAEIYEGDVVKGHSVYPSASEFESFLMGEVYYTNRGTWDCCSYILGGFNEQVEVIGNIYENPDF